MIGRKKLLTLTWLLLTLLSAGSITSKADTIPVTNNADSGPGSLRAALATAASGDIIDATGMSGEIVLMSGELLITKDLNIIGPGPDHLAINGNFPNNTSRILHVTNGVTVSISGLSITKGNDFEGGAIFNDVSVLTVSNCVFTGNYATIGGALCSGAGHSGGASLTLVSCTLSNNSAEVGGAIYNWGEPSSATLTIIGSTIAGNSAGDAGAGGIKNDGSPNCSAATFVTNCTITANTTTGYGGGIQNDGLSGNATLVVVNSTLSGNQAASYGGGAIFSDGGNGNAAVLLINTTLSGNSANVGGAIRNGGINYGNTLLTLLNCTFGSNSASAGSAIANVASQLQIGSSIVAAGSSSNIFNAYATITSFGYNLCSDDAAGWLTNATDRINLDPMLGPLLDNGGPVFTHALLLGSPAMDMGTNFAGVLTDARGFPRTFDDPAIPNALGGDGTDIGAYETPQLRITSVRKLGDDLRLTFASTPGGQYEVQTQTNLGVDWVSVSGALSATSGIAEVTLTNAFIQPQMLYRIHQLP